MDLRDLEEKIWRLFTNINSPSITARRCLWTSGMTEHWQQAGRQAESCLGKKGKGMNKTSQAKRSAQSSSVCADNSFSSDSSLPDPFLTQMFRSTEEVWKPEINVLKHRVTCIRNSRHSHVTPWKSLSPASSEVKKKKKKVPYQNMPVCSRYTVPSSLCHARQAKACVYQSAEATPCTLWLISLGPVHENVIIWPCLSSQSRKHKSGSVSEGSCRHTAAPDALWRTEPLS